MREVSKILASLVVGAALCATTAAAQTHDPVILNGRVMDPETMFDAIANVCIKDGRIQAITKESITGKETIDATGLVVAPGFIDTHFHSVDVFADFAMFEHGNMGRGINFDAARDFCGVHFALGPNTGPVDWSPGYHRAAAKMLAGG